MRHETGAVPDPAQLADRFAIYDVLVAHCRGVDRSDAEILRSCYWPDAEVAYGVFNGNAHRFCAFLPKAIAVYARTQHCIGNVAIDFDGDAARVETYVTAYHYVEATDGDREVTYLARYLDRMEKRDDVWKLSHRRVVVDWNREVSASPGSGVTADGFARGARAPDDPLYAHLAR
jgi:SnoaL-like domain